jgi:RNA polymerase sporulation-specific sigma factor
MEDPIQIPDNRKKGKDDSVRDLLYRSQHGDEAARCEIVSNNTRLVWSVVQRFSNRGIEQEDLFQIGCIGLLKSVDKFDLSYDVRFSTYAVPMIIGEIQRFLRDNGTLKISRSIKEMSMKIKKVKESFMQEQQRNPTIQEIAQTLQVEKEEVILALDAMRQPTSIYETVFENEGDPITLLDQIQEPNQGKWFEQFTLHEAISELRDRERLIVYLRYFRDQTQIEVAQRLGISQVQVSRLEKKILKQLKISIINLQITFIY